MPLSPPFVLFLAAALSEADAALSDAAYLAAALANATNSLAPYLRHRCFRHRRRRFRRRLSGCCCRGLTLRTAVNIAADSDGDSADLIAFAA